MLPLLDEKVDLDPVLQPKREYEIGLLAAVGYIVLTNTGRSLELQLAQIIHISIATGTSNIPTAGMDPRPIKYINRLLGGVYRKDLVSETKLSQNNLACEF